MSVAMQAISDLNLEQIKVKLMHPSGEGWSQAKATVVETEYRRFLYLAKVFPAEPKAPGVSVDLFWHYHILDTMKYAADCAAAFGYFVHHYPSLGLSDSADDAAARDDADQRTRALYARVFADAGTEPAQAAAYCFEAGGVARAEQGEAAAYCFEAATGADAVKGEAAAYCFEAGAAARAIQGEGSAYCFEASNTVRAIKAEAAAYCFEAGNTARAVKGEAAAYCFEAGTAATSKQASTVAANA